MQASNKNDSMIMYLSFATISHLYQVAIFPIAKYNNDGSNEMSILDHLENLYILAITTEDRLDFIIEKATLSLDSPGSESVVVGPSGPSPHKIWNLEQR
jgi:hypothetical protein